MDDQDLLDVLDAAVVAAGTALDELDDWGPSGIRPGQYRLDLAADKAALGVLHGAGLAVLSEESGHTAPEGASGGPSDATGAPDASLLAVLDPVDGSTNAFHGLPWYSTSICVLDAEGPRVALVVNHATGARYHAIRGRGAFRDDRPIGPSSCSRLRDALIATTGWPHEHFGWRQLRVYGASSLDMCAAAEGVVDGFVVTDDGALFGWDYLGALLVCTEAGAVVGDRDGAELVVRDDTRRQPVVAATSALFDALRGALK